jgi:hypothetical protein
VTDQTRSGQREQADTFAYEAGCYYKSGDTVRAAQLIGFAEALDPALQEVWDQRREQILSRARQLPWTSSRRLAWPQRASRTTRSSSAATTRGIGRLWSTREGYANLVA